MKILTKLGLAALLLFLVLGCDSGLVNGNEGDTVDFTLNLEIPDFSDPLAMEQQDAERSASSRAVAPQMHYITVKISGEGFSDIERTFERGFDTGNSYFSTTDGYGYCSLTIPDVPLGRNRLLSVSTFDSLYNPLTAGSTTTNIDLNDTYYSLYLSPVNATMLSLDTSVSGMVPQGSVKYYCFETLGGNYERNQEFLVELTSQLQDVNLYLYTSTGGNKSYAWRNETPPVNEAVLFECSESRVYVAVYGNSPGTNAFEIQVGKVEDEEFSTYYKMVEMSPSAFTSIAGDAEATEIYPSIHRPFGEVSLDADFHLNFHGTPYGSLFVSPNGYLSFLKYNNYYRWYDPADWSFDNWWRWYPWWNGSWTGYYAPNDVVSLYMCPFYFPEADSKILYKTDTVTLSDGGEYDRVIVEYHKVYHRKEDLDPAADRYLTGQIIITEGKIQPDGTYEDATIDLIYDRSNTVMDAIRGYIGLKNSTGDDRIGLGSFSGYDEIGDAISAPLSDYQFRNETGGFDIILQ